MNNTRKHLHSNHLNRLSLLFIFSLLFVGCTGGGDDEKPTESYTISGTVAGTEIIAVNDIGDIIASDGTAGKTADSFENYPFTLTGIPLSVNIRVYLITGSGVYPLYFDSTGDANPNSNVFSSSAIVDIDLGFVDTAVAGQDGKAIPTNNPVDVSGVSPKPENTAIPANASLIGTWGFGRLKHRNSGTWAAKSGKLTYNADGTGTSVRQENDDNTFTSGPKTWTWTATGNNDGSITVIRSYPDSSTKTQRFVISDDGMVMIMDGTDNLNNQRFRIAIRMDPAKTYTNADFSGVYYDIQYSADWNSIQYQHSALSGEQTPNGAGIINEINSAGNTDGGVGGADCPSSCGTYTVNAGGSIAFNGGPMESYLSGDGGLGVGASSNSTDKWAVRLIMKKADRTYSTADLAGTWAYISFQDNNNGASYAAVFGTMICLSDGNCTANAKFNRDGTITVESDDLPALSVAVDGSFGLSFGSVAYAGAIGNDGKVIVMNTSFVDTTTRRTFVGVRCSACAGLENGGL